MAVTLTQRLVQFQFQDSSMNLVMLAVNQSKQLLRLIMKLDGALNQILIHRLLLLKPLLLQA